MVLSYILMILIDVDYDQTPIDYEILSSSSEH